MTAAILPDAVSMCAARAVLGLAQGQVDILIEWGELERSPKGITIDSIHRYIGGGKKMEQMEIEK